MDWIGDVVGFFFITNKALKFNSFGPLLDIGLLVPTISTSVLSLISPGGSARDFLLHTYMQPAWHNYLVNVTFFKIKLKNFGNIS